MNIIDWYSVGGNPSNKPDGKTLMYLVQQGDTITFSLTSDVIANFEWLVNKSQVLTTFNQITDSYVFTVPYKKDIWEIHVIVSDGTTTFHHEWVISTMPDTEKPVFFDYFSDGDPYNLSRTNDPWGRQLLTWTVQLSGINADTKSLYCNDCTTNPNIEIYPFPLTEAYGTFKFWLKFSKFSQSVAEYSNANIQLYGTTEGKSCLLSIIHPIGDVHDYFHINSDARIGMVNGYRRLDRNGLAQAPAYFRVEDDKWHEVTMIHDREGFWRLYYDNETEKDKIDNNDVFEFINRMGIYLRNHAMIDNIIFYEDKYLTPGTGNIIYKEYVYLWKWKPGPVDKATEYFSDPVFRMGINIYGEATLNNIFNSISNSLLFSYDGIVDGKDTYTCHTDLVMRQGSKLVINNEVLRFACTYPGQLIFRVKAGTHLEITNSTIKSTTIENHFIWGFTSQGLLDTGCEDIIMYRTAPDPSTSEGYSNNRMSLNYFLDARVIVENSVIDNCSNFWLESPIDLVLRNVVFDNLLQELVGDYTTNTIQGPATRQYPKERLNFSKSFGLWSAMNMYRCIIENVTVKGKTGNPPIDVLFMGGIDTLTEHYVKDMHIENAKIKTKVGFKYAPHEGYDNFDINCKVNIVNMDNYQMVDTPTTNREEILTTVYFDMKVVDASGNPVQGVSVYIENEQEPYLEPPQNIRYMKIPFFTLEALGGMTMDGIPNQLSQGGWYDRWMGDIRRMRHPKYYIELLKIGKEDDSFGQLYEIAFMPSVPIDVLINGLRETTYDPQGRLIYFKYYTLYNTTLPMDWYSVSNITYDADDLITSYVKYGEGTGETLQQFAFGSYTYFITYNKINNVIKDYIVKRTDDKSGWVSIRTFNVSSLTLENGHTPPVTDRENTIVLPIRKIKDVITTNYTYTIKIFKDNKQQTISNFNIDDSWYRNYPDTPNKTLVFNLDTGQWTVECPVPLCDFTIN